MKTPTHQFPESVAERIPNLAPMVDVIMVILVFFILGASLELTREGILQTQLDPRSGPGPGAAIEIIPVVKIGLERTPAGCRVYLMGRPIGENAFAELADLLDQRRRAGADTAGPVVIGAQQQVRWQFVVAAMDAAVRAGFHNVQFAVSLGESEKQP